MANVLVHLATGPEARGIDEGGELAPPARLVELSVWADTVLTY